MPFRHIAGSVHRQDGHICGSVMKLSLTQTEQTFVTVLRAALRNERVELQTAMDQTEWEQLIRMVIQQKLLPMFVSAVPVQCLPDGELLKRGAIRQAVGQTRNTSAFLALYAALQAAGFHPRVVKGIVCRGLYPQGDLRPSSDEDVYIPDGEFTACCDFLRAYGMEPTGETAPDAHEIGWVKPGTALYIELHRRLFSPDLRISGDLERFFDPSVYADYTTETGAVIQSLPPHEHMLYLLLHAYKHFIHSGFGIRQVCDIGLWAKAYAGQIDWALLEQQCRSCNALKFAAAVLTIAAVHLQIPLTLPDVWRVPETLCEPLLADMLSGGIYGTSDSDRHHSATVTLNAVEADRDGTHSSIWKSVFLKREFMEKKFPYLRKFPILLPVAWIQRIFQYLLHSAGGSRHISTTIAIGNERVQLLKLYDIIK